MLLSSHSSDVVCIIGMHRSGTSMITRLLNLCGLYLGPADQLLGPNGSNPLGHFEHTGFQRINETLLEHYGGSWDNPPELKPGWHHDPALRELSLEAKLLVGKFSHHGPWGWKEPRTTILVPFWKSIIPNLRFVICVRSPIEVAKSLSTRDGFSIENGVHLWKRYMRASIRDTEGCARIFTFYENYFTEVTREVSRVVDFCGLQRPGDLSVVQNSIANDLRHQRSETKTLLDAGDIPAEHKLFYISLRAVSCEGFVETGTGIQNWGQKNIARLLNLVEELHDQEKMVQLQTALSDLHARMDAELRGKQVQMIELEQQAAQLQQKISGLEQENTRLKAFADTVRGTVAYRCYRRFIKPFSRGRMSC